MSRLETLTRPTSQNFRHLEVVILPNEGGRSDPSLKLSDTEVIARPINRFTAHPESLVPQDQTFIDSEIFMETVMQRRYEFYNELGLIRELNVVRNYDVPLARVMWEQMKTDDQKRQWQEYETDQIFAALGERHNLVDIIPRYIIDSNRKFRYAPMPVEQFEEADKRAIEHYKNLKSPDLVREEAGFRGRLKIQEKLSDPNTPLDTAIIQISGPGLAKGSKQRHNFMWEYVLRKSPVTGQRFVEVTPLISNANYPQYESYVSKLKPQYFEGMVGPIDLHLLENPIEFRSKDLASEFTKNVGQVKEYKPNPAFQQFKEENKPRVKYFLEAICAAIFDPYEAAKRWDAVVVGGDIVWKQINKLGQKIKEGVSVVAGVIRKFGNMTEEVAYLAKQKIEKFLAACGLSGGLLKEGLFGMTKMAFSALIGMATSVGILEKDDMGGLYYACPTCGAVNKRTKGETDKQCGSESCKSGKVSCEPIELRNKTKKSDNSSYELPMAA